MSNPKLSIKKLDNGKYQYSFEKAKVDGKRSRVYKTFDTKDEAYKEGLRAYNLYYSDGITVKDTMTFSELAQLWLEMDCKNRVADETVEIYKKKIKNQILPYIGDKYLNTILAMHLNSMLTELNDNGISRNTLINVKALLTSIFRFAVCNRFLNYDPSYNLKLPSQRVKTTIKTKSSPHHFLSDRTMYDIFKVLKDNLTHYLIVKLGYECGLRRAEIFGLFWNDIDFTLRTMTIRRQMQYYQDRTRDKEDIKKNNGTNNRGNGYWYYKLPKYDSIRTISISTELAKLLRDYQELQLKNRHDKNITTIKNYVDEYPSEDCKFSKISQNESGFEINPVFVKENGEFETPNICMYITAKIRKNGIKNFDMHSLRKTHSTILQNNGFNIKYVAERLGHTDVKTTTEVYYELSNKVIESQNLKLDELFEATKKQGLMEGSRIVTINELLNEPDNDDITIEDDSKPNIDTNLVDKMEDTKW